MYDVIDNRKLDSLLDVLLGLVSPGEIARHQLHRGELARPHRLLHIINGRLLQLETIALAHGEEVGGASILLQRQQIGRVREERLSRGPGSESLRREEAGGGQLQLENHDEAMRQAAEKRGRRRRRLKDEMFSLAKQSNMAGSLGAGGGGFQRNL